MMGKCDAGTTREEGCEANPLIYLEIAPTRGEAARGATGRPP